MRTHRLVTLLLVGILHVASTGLVQAQSDMMRRDPVGLNGLPGLVHVPRAGAVPTGTADVTFDNALQQSLGSHLGLQRNVFLTVGFLPRLSLAGRGTMARDSANGNELRDLSVAAQLLVVEEGERWPALAVGIVDPDTGGNPPYFTTYYVTATKTMLDHARVTAGYGLGPQEPDGLFGGLELDLGPWASAMGEFDGDRWNGGVRLFPFTSAAERWGINPRFDVVYREGVGEAFGFGTRIALGGPQRRTVRPAAGVTAQAATLPRSPESSADAVLRELVSFGLENVRVWEGSDGRTLAIEYENRVFNRNEWDALGVVMGVAAVHGPDAIEHLDITIRRVDVPVLRVETGLEAFRGYLAGEISDEAFADQLRVSAPSRASGHTMRAANPSRWKLDFFVRPRAETTLLTEVGNVGVRLTVLPDAYLHLGNGFVLNGRATIDAGHSDGFPWWIDDPNSDRLLLHKAMRVGLTERWGPTNALTQFSAGWFRHDVFGIANEIDVSLGDGRWSFGSTLAAFGSEPGEIDGGAVLGNLRVRRPSMDLTARLEGGIFRRGDAGVSAELSRFFGDTEVGFYLRSTTFGSVAGIRLSLPLTPARELRPTRVRARLPDVYTHTQQITVFEYPSVLRRHVGRLMETDHELGRAFRDRNRMHLGDLRANVDVLRRAVYRWALQ